MTKWLANLLGGRSTVTNPLGERGENLAAKHLRNKGYRILIRNFTCKFGEVDIIARDGRTLVFVEVKTRRDDDEPMPEDQVGPNKQRQVAKVADHYLSRFGMPQPPARFDVVAITWPTGREPQIRHDTDAFEMI